MTWLKIKDVRNEEHLINVERCEYIKWFKHKDIYQMIFRFNGLDVTSRAFHKREDIMEYFDFICDLMNATGVTINKSYSRNE